MFTKVTQYGLKALTFLAQHCEKEQYWGVKRIAREIDAPEAFCSKVLQELSRRKILLSAKGPRGGFKLAQAPQDVFLITIVEILEGRGLVKDCVLGFKQCSDAVPCPFHVHYAAIRQELEDLLQRLSLAQLVSNVTEGQAVLRMLKGA